MIHRTCTFKSHVFHAKSTNSNVKFPLVSNIYVHDPSLLRIIIGSDIPVNIADTIDQVISPNAGTYITETVGFVLSIIKGIHI